MFKGCTRLLICALAAYAGVSLSSGQKTGDPFTQLRKRMVKEQLADRDISDPRVLTAMEEVPRHRFVRPEERNLAYEDSALPIDEGQTISQPYIVALMTQSLKVKKQDRVLEIGTGSGYQAAVLSLLVDHVFSIEINEQLAEHASQVLKELHYDNVTVKAGDGYKGWEEHAPFDAVIVTCAASRIPAPLFEQLKEGGTLVIPLDQNPLYQVLTRVTKKKGKQVIERLLNVRFVPMTGEIKKRKK